MDPYDPEARVCFGMGPDQRHRSPLNGPRDRFLQKPAHGRLRRFGNMGGHWGAEVKFAGYDQIIVQGKAKNPVYIWIDDDKVEIRDARHLWGKFPREADQMIKEELGDEDIHIMLIGPAGENMVRFACTFNDVWRAAGRTGTGGVIGSKNLKGIAATVLKHREGCFSCPICCGRFTQIRKANGQVKSSAVPNTSMQFPSTHARCGIIEDANDIWHNARLTNDYGMDAIECGGVISTAMEWYQRGFITTRNWLVLSLNGVMKRLWISLSP